MAELRTTPNCCSNAHFFSDHVPDSRPDHDHNDDHQHTRCESLHIVQGQDSSLLSICFCSQVRMILWEWIFLWQQQNFKIILRLWYQRRGVRNHHHHDEQDLSMDEHEYEYEAWVWMAAIPRCLPPRTVTSFPFCPNRAVLESNIWVQTIFESKQVLVQHLSRSTENQSHFPPPPFRSVLTCIFLWGTWATKTPRSVLDANFHPLPFCPEQGLLSSMSLLSSHVRFLALNQTTLESKIIF